MNYNELKEMGIVEERTAEIAEVIALVTRAERDLSHEQAPAGQGRRMGLRGGIPGHGAVGPGADPVRGLPAERIAQGHA